VWAIAFFTIKKQEQQELQQEIDELRTFESAIRA
jgi:hypothetical protein